jgi:hypothetical protein
MNMIATAAAAAVATPTDAPALPAVKPQIEALDDNKLRTHPTGAVLRDGW